MPLKPFQKGYDPRRSMKGRPPKAVYIPDILQAIGNENLPDELRGKLPADIQKSSTMLDALMRCVYRRAFAGEGWAVQFVAERTEGKVKDVMRVEGGQRLEIVEEIVDAPSTAPGAG